MFNALDTLHATATATGLDGNPSVVS